MTTCTMLPAFAFLVATAMPAAVSAGEAPVETAATASTVVSLDGPNWLLAPDPKNVGRQQQWFHAPRPDAKKTKVPWIIQEAFPEYHGVAWYWREFASPVNERPGGRYLLRFWMVDYKAEVWLNDVLVGGHEGGEGAFVLDVTKAIQPGKTNRLAVRVLNPTHEPIDGITLGQTPRRCKVIPFRAGALYNDGGIVDSVELLLTPAARIAGLCVRPDVKTGVIAVEARVVNAAAQTTRGRLDFAVAPAANGSTLQSVHVERELPPGETVVAAQLKVDQPRLWNLNDPNLYRVTSRVAVGESPVCFDEQSTRCGFRDFRFENGHFRLNGKRIFLKCSHTATHYPIGQHWPHDADLARRDLLNVKTMGFNAIRFFCAVPARHQLELCDELGLMIYEENYAGWMLEDSPKMAERFDRSTAEMILRDRNHPSVVMWGLLNETSDGAVFRHAIKTLPLVRSLDDTRVVMLNSGMYFFVNQGAGGLAGISRWHGAPGMEPNVTFNGTKSPIRALGILWTPGSLALHPGPNNEYCSLRFAAPSAGDYVIEGKFASIAENATTDVHVLLGKRPALFDGFINLHDAKSEAAFAKKVSLTAGDAVDFVVGSGNASYGGDATGLTLSIRSPDGKKFNPSADFSDAKNPNGPWRYGFLKPGATPDASTFQAFAEGETLGAKIIAGAISNPGSNRWEDIVSDQHPYKRVPHTAGIIQELRTASEGDRPVFISEYGIGSGVDFVRITRHFEQLGAEKCEDAQWYRQRLDQFMADWKRWRLDDTFANPETFFRDCLAKMGKQRLLGLNAIRANPRAVGHSVTGTVDQANSGEGLFTTFRELKPGTVDSMFDGWYPLRWCLFVEPVHVYRKTPVRLEAVLANEDVLSPGKYPVRLQVVGPGNVRVFDRTITVTVPGRKGNEEPPFAMPVFSENVVIDGPPGKYEFHTTFEKGAAAAGGQAEFYVADAAETPKVEREVALWGNDAELAQWLAGRGIRVRPFASGPATGREVILASREPAGPGDAKAFGALARRIAQGSTAVFLCPSVFAKKDKPLAWLPLATKGELAGLPSWLYHKDEWAKRHPIFDGLPSGGLMDYTFYREIIPDGAFVGQDTPAEAVAGATNTSIDYSAGLMVSVHRFGGGQFILNTLLIRENLGKNPAADRLLVNMLRYAARDAEKPLVALPADFERQLKAIGYAP
jgi:hypothetical protein